MSDPNSQNFQAPLPPTSTPVVKRYPKNMRVAAIILFVLGIAVLIAGLGKIVPGGLGTGGAVAFLGALFFGLSFIRLPEVKPDAPAPLGTLEQLGGIFYEPTRVFRNLRSHPRWLAGLLVIAFLNVAYVFAFTQRLTPERIVNYTVDKMAETPFIPPDAVEKARDQGLQDAKSPAMKAGNVVKGVVGAFVFMCFIAGVYLVVLLAFGGRINFWQAFAVAVYSALPVVVVTKVVSFILLYLKSPDDIHPLMGQETLLQDNLGLLFSPKDNPVLFVAATAIGILSFYKLWLTAKGLHEGGERVSSSAGWGVSITLWVLWLIFSIAITALFPSFIS